MKTKNYLSKNIFYIFFAFILLGAGVLFLPKGQTTLADTGVSATAANLPVEFGKEEFVVTNGEETPSEDSLLDSDIFAFYNDTSTNKLKLSLKQNGTEVGVESEQFNHVFYPDPQNKAVFYYYTGIHLELHINGVKQELGENRFVTTTELFFDNGGIEPLQDFEMVFDKDGKGSHSIALLDENGALKEGLYTLNLYYTLHITQNGNLESSQMSFREQAAQVEYSFYIVNRDSYLVDGLPNAQHGAFDHKVKINDMQKADAYYLYSNYTSKDNGEGLKDGTLENKKIDQIPYIEYDYTRFELGISKELSGSVQRATLNLNIQNNQTSLVLTHYSATGTPTTVLNGLELVKFQTSSKDNKCRVYFTEVGVYTVTFNAIKVITVNDAMEKHALDGLSAVTKTFKVHMYGLQLKYPDYDEQPDANNARPRRDLHEYDIRQNEENELIGQFSAGADITSKFINFKSSYASDGTTFTATNVFDFINKHADDCTCAGDNSCAQKNPEKEITGDIKYDTLAPVQTNQTPLMLVSNANLTGTSSEQSTVKNYIFTTANIAGYSPSRFKIGDESVYQLELNSGFGGQLESVAGKYVVLASYTYNNYYENESSLNTVKRFYQVFYFEIVKELRAIETVTQTTASPDKVVETPVTSGAFTNQNVIVRDTTKKEPFNKDVTVQIYAWDYVNENWLNDFGGEYGIKLQNFNGGSDNEITLAANARYTIRLYYTSEISNTNINSQTGFKREQTFTIDKLDIEGLSMRNFQQQDDGSTNYVFHSNMSTFSTNLAVGVSWEGKKSGASTSAYYRYFPLVSGTNGQYYSTSSTNNNHNILQAMLNANYMPINRVLDLDTTQGDWLPYQTNTYGMERNVPLDYIFTQAGFYIVDVYDAAGNHSVEMFMIDDSSPMFARKDEKNVYSLAESAFFIDKSTTICWGKNKAIYVHGLTEDLFKDAALDKVPENLDTYPLFKTHQGVASDKIWKKMYEKLYSKDYLKKIDCGDAATKDETVSSLISSYTGMYIVVPIEKVSWYNDGKGYTKQGENQDVSSQTITADTAKTYTLLIRDQSNNKWAQGTGQQNGPTKDASTQYTLYYSARQIVYVSFDTSNFLISYQQENGTTVETIPITSNDRDSSTADEDNQKTETIYLSPVRFEKPLIVSFIPTVNTTQVDTVTWEYYEFVRGSKEVANANGETGKTLTYNYTVFSKEPTIKATYYTFNEQSAASPNEKRTYNLNLDGQNMTKPGKYILTRTYKTGGDYTINDKDSYKLTYILIVDRNEIVSNQTEIDDGDNKSHIESLVGGDIFVAMYDTGLNKNLVVTFPNSEESNTDGTTITSNSLSSNKLPVRVYVPQFKYTRYVQRVPNKDNPLYYNFKVDYNFADESQENDTMNHFTKEHLVREYALYASIYTSDPTLPTSVPIAITSKDSSDPTNPNKMAENVTAENGFLTFYKYGTQETLTEIYDPGTYWVKIEQGRFTQSDDTTSFNRTTIFKFEIEKTTPDFNVQTDDFQTLTTMDNPAAGINQAYYTNSKILNISWHTSQLLNDKKYKAEIDVKKIVFETGSIGNNRVIETFDTDDSDSTHGGDVWQQAPELQNDGDYLGKLDLSKLNVYQNNFYVDITMQYENHDIAVNAEGNIYDKVKKRVYVDLMAPSENVQALVSKSVGYNKIAPLKEDALRTWSTADNNTPATSLENTSYNTSNQSGTFASYTYPVELGYLEQIRTSAASDVTIYLRQLEENNMKETIPNQFYETNFDTAYEIGTSSGKFTWQANKYYEIVEMDRAKNMSIYTVYVYDRSQNQDLINYNVINEQGLTSGSYTTEMFNETASHAGAIHNIYARTEFVLTNIFFFGDAWTQFELTTYSLDGSGNTVSSTSVYMVDPNNTGTALKFVGNNPPTSVDLSDLIDGSKSLLQKHVLTLYNRLDGSTSTIYINVRNTNLSANFTTTQDREYISFYNVSNSELESTSTASQYAYVTKMRIKLGDNYIYGDSEHYVENRLGYANGWQNFSTSTDFTNPVKVYVASGRLFFEINPNLPETQNAKVTYEYVDNYGKKYKEVHLFHEAVISQEITSANPGDPEYRLYAYYNNVGDLVYVIKDGLNFTYNPNKYTYKAYLVKDNAVTSTEFKSSNTIPNGNETITERFAMDMGDKQYYVSFVIRLYDIEDPENYLREIHCILYNYLPIGLTDDTKDVEEGNFKIRDTNNKNITEDILSNTLANPNEDAGYYSQVRITYERNTNPLVPVRYSISKDNATWEEISSGKRLVNTTGELETYYLKIWYDEQFLRNELGNQLYVFGEVPQSRIYIFRLSALITNYWVEMQEDDQWVIVDKDDSTYKAPDGTQYSNHYIVNVSYENKDLVRIQTNSEQDIQKPTEFDPYRYPNSDVVSVKYLITNADEYGNTAGNVPRFEAYIVITYVPPTQNFVQEFFTFNQSGIIDTSENLIETNTKTVAIGQNSNLDRIQLQWSKYYGIPENEISIKLKLDTGIGDPIELKPVTYSRRSEDDVEYNYIYLIYSGLYHIQFEDSSHNIQHFTSENVEYDDFTFIFLKDVPFTVTYTNPITNETETSLPIKQAVYNSSVTLNINREQLQTFYSVEGYPTISVQRNGVAYEKEFDSSTSFTFDESGYYEVKFTATSNQDVGALREETYQFTILNANENRVSYVYNKYSNYYIQSVEKDGVDITDELIRTMDLETVSVRTTQSVVDEQTNETKLVSVVKDYITQLPISYLDEKTGNGEYTFTINTNNKYYNNFNSVWTFKVKIDSGTAPLKISLAEGESTTGKISVSYNKANLYLEMGECTLRIAHLLDNGNIGISASDHIDATSEGENTLAINSTGTYFVQIIAPSGTLLFSYKVIRNEPMNAASIIAIVASVVVLVVIIFIIIKLRKRISVK